MPFAEPVQGLVIRYSYLWQSEKALGRGEGGKDRPCAVVLVTDGSITQKIVTVLPITHRRPDNVLLSVEIPAATKARLGLDSERSWVLLSEANRFRWPDPDLPPGLAHDASSLAYGLLPYRLMEQIRLKFIVVLKDRRSRVITRTE